ncbi:hypothetical protein F0U62_32360 [Cystobacter fuscus]|uniref:ADYC domain-containing protein n=1 Tax=Cystobacter fuscus TaxID=43 RepID=UPI002B2B80E1|nr:hypothetical protein F0U62_32360 [Cystobacter fuscus]
MKAEWKSCTAPALVALVIGCWSTLAAAEPTASTSSDCIPCTEPNGRGIYIREGMDYCIEHGDMRFCPEAFVQGSAQEASPVHLAGRFFWKNQSPFESWQMYPVRATLGRGKLVTLTGFKVQGAHLSFLYKYSPSDPESEADLSTLTLTISPNDMGRWQLSFKKRRDQGYTGTWTGSGGVTQDFCPDKPLMNEPPMKLMNLLPGKQVDGKTGKVTEESRMVTMACYTGAIATCMRWGYNPSDLGEPATTENALLGACIQAKRAAYFLASGDTSSYTQNGKTIAMQDHYKVKKDPITALEAVWTENGAECLNLDNRRINNPPLPTGWNTKLHDSCSNDYLKIGPGEKYIFTGKVAQP